MRKLLISSAVAATVLATTGMAQVATDGTGQFLIAPGFFAKDGFETKLKLVNTDLTHSVIYRAAIREFEASQELDFIVTLSPGDVWDGRIYKDADGVYVQSSDSSTYRNSLNTPVKISDVYKNASAVSRSFEKGYVEFYPVASYAEGSDKKVEKSVLYDRFDNLTKGVMTGASVVGDDMVAGYTTVVSTTIGAVSTIPMMAFEGVQTSLKTPAAAGADTVPSTYIDETTVYGDLTKTDVTVPFEAGGANDGIYLAFWNDHFDETKAGCSQYREYTPVSRDMDENRGKAGKNYISPAPKTAPNTVKCEFATLPVKNVLAAAGTPSYTEGMVQLSGMKTTVGEQKAKLAGKAAFVATNMSARPVNDSYSYSWVYAPVR